jgi:hypothetical protein
MGVGCMFPVIRIAYYVSPYAIRITQYALLEGETNP